MSSFIGCVDFDADGKRASPPASLAELEVTDGLAEGRFCSGPVSIDWRAAPGAPIGRAHSARGGFCLVIGHVELDEEGIVEPAAHLLEQAEKDPGSIATFGGYSFAIARCADGTVCMGADHLGHFPVYYHVEGERLHFATSPSLLRHLPGYRARLDPRGVVTLMLMAQGSRGHTLWRGVRRLDECAALVVRPGRAPHVVRSAPVAPGDGVFDEAEIDDVADRALAALRPVHPPRDDTGVAVLLSGGLDSRIVAGLLAREGHRIDASITLGVPGDLELACASRVANALGLSQVCVPDDSSLDPVEVTRAIVSEGLAFDCLAFNFQRAVPTLRTLGVPVVNGFVGDRVLGGTHLAWGRNPETGRQDFESLFARCNRYGFGPERLGGLLRPSFCGDAIDEEIAELRQIYADLPGREDQKVWRFDLMHRQRLQIAAIDWRLSFGSWPVSPYAQKRVLRLAVRLPLALLEGRRLQRRMLVRHFPELARLPVDGALFRTEPVLAGPWERIASPVRARSRRLRMRWTGRDPRYYARIFDFDGEGFRALRRHVDPMIEVLDDVFEPDALRALLPRPDERRRYADPFADSAGWKSILGLALLMSETGLEAR